MVISEIYFNPDDDFNSEFVEFYNPTDKSLDLTNWEFREDSDKEWINLSEDTDEQVNLSVPAGGFLLLVDEVSYSLPSSNGQGIERKACSSSTVDSMRDGGEDEDRGNAYDTGDSEEDFVGPLSGEPQNTDSPPEFQRHQGRPTPAVPTPASRVSE